MPAQCGWLAVLRNPVCRLLRLHRWQHLGTATACGFPGISGFLGGLCRPASATQPQAGRGWRTERCSPCLWMSQRCGSAAGGCPAPEPPPAPGETRSASVRPACTFWPGHKHDQQAKAEQLPSPATPTRSNHLQYQWAHALRAQVRVPWQLFSQSRQPPSNPATRRPWNF